MADDVKINVEVVGLTDRLCLGVAGCVSFSSALPAKLCLGVGFEMVQVW